MVLVWTQPPHPPPPPHAKACVSRNCDPIDFGRTLSILEQIGKTKMAAGGHFVKI